MSVQTKPRVEFDADVETELARTDGPEDFTGWYCVATAPFPCPAVGCDYIAQHMTAAHRIIVWPDADDRILLSYARDARDLGRDPRVVPYEKAFGPCIAYDQWYAIGRPIHSRLDRPDGWLAGRGYL